MKPARTMRIVVLAALALLGSRTIARAQESSEATPGYDPSGEFLSELLADPLWRQQQPDFDEYYELYGPDLVAPDPSVTAYFTHLKVSGVGFVPRDSATGWSYFGTGCISSKGADYFVFPLDVPSGSRIDYVRLFYYDTSASNSRLYLTWYDGAGGYSDLKYADSAGTGGFGSSLSAYVGEIVDPENRSYMLVWRPNAVGTSMALCGARVAYRLPELVR